MTSRQLKPAYFFTITFFALLFFVPAPESAAQGKIAFASSRTGNNEIFAMNQDGTNLVNLTNNPADERWPSLNPNGTKVVFASDRGGRFDIYISNTIGSPNPINLTGNIGLSNFQPSFSSDGSKIVFMSNSLSGNNDIIMMNADGTNPIGLSNYVNARDPSFSPDGTKVTFAARFDNESDIFVVNTNGAPAVRINGDPGFDIDPSFSPDGSKIVFQSNRDGNDEIYVMNADGTGVVRLTQDGSTDAYPVFSPDGTKIAFCSNRSGSFNLYVMNVDGSNQLPITNTPGADNLYPAWVNTVTGPPELYDIQLPTPISEGGTAMLTGNMYSPDLAQSLSLSVNWGDGSPVQIFNYPAGTTVFNESHQYLDDPPSLNDSFYQIGLTLTTVHGMAAGGTPVFVGNAVPQITVSFPPIAQLGSPTSLNLTVGDAGTLDTHTINVDWGDGSQPTVLNLAAGVLNTSASHTYSALGRYVISATVSDDDGGNSTPTSVYTGIVPPPTIGKIAFTSSYGGNDNIWIMNSNGTGQVALTTNPANDYFPNISKDGRKIVFVSERDGNVEIYTMDAAGAFQTRLTNNAAEDSQPAFSPDGSKIVFTSHRDGNYEIYIMNSDGTGLLRLTNNAADDGQAEFSPDGTKIIFARLSGAEANIFTMNLDGSGQTALTSGFLEGNGFPSYSPNGQKIVFSKVTLSTPNGEIYVMDANGGNQQRLTVAAGNDQEPVFSPDGTKIAFRSERDGNAEIYIMDANGDNQQRITFDGAGVSNFAPSWVAVPTVSVDIDDTLAAESGTSLTVPIIVTDTTGKGIISYDFTLNYDPMVLTPQSVAFDKTSTLSAGLTINAGETMPGKLVVSGFGSVPLTGAGTLLKLKFDVVGTAPTSSDLTLSPFMFNEGIPYSDVAGGHVFVQGTIDGRVTYGTAATTVGVPNVTINAVGSPNASTTTAANGNYHLGGFGPGSYTVTPSKTGDNNGINALDASLISQFLVRATTLTANQQAAGEVSGNGTLSSFDAALIAQYVALLPNTGSTGTWRFLPSSRTYETVGSLINEDYSAILMGEVSGDWAASLAGISSKLKTVDDKAGASLSNDSPVRPPKRSATVALGSGKVKMDRTISVPVTLKFTGPATRVMAYQFDVVFDPQVIQPEAAVTVETLSSSFSVVTNPNTPGRLRIVVYGAGSISSNGTLINLVFRAVGRVNSSSDVSIANLLLNEGDPAADPKSGKITVTR
jgi:Tol biopolymer transport system component